jgi:hypothetical protein
VNSRELGWRRAQATHLGERLAPSELATAAWGGLQDSAPRAALFGLHARVAGVGPGSWEDPALAQIWFRRGADYVVPREDLAVFTLGASPRDAALMDGLEELAARALRVLDGRPQRTRQVGEALGLDHDGQMRLKWTSVTGRLLIRWDASTIELIPHERPDVDPENARVELARRFLTWHGPAAPAQFAKWAGVPPADAALTWRALEPELVAVTVVGTERSLLAADAHVAVTPHVGVRLLPGLGDPFLAIDRELLEPPQRLPLPAVGPDVPPRLLNSLIGRVLLDGELVGAWGRVQHKVTLFAWRPLAGDEVDRIDSEVELMAGPVGRPITRRWLDWSPADAT